MATSKEFDNLFSTQKGFFHAPYAFKSPLLLTFEQTFKNQFASSSKLNILGKIMGTPSGFGGSHLLKYKQSKFYIQEKLKSSGGLWISAGYSPEFFKGFSFHGVLRNTPSKVEKEFSAKYKSKPIVLNLLLNTDPIMALSLTYKQGSHFHYGLDASFDLETSQLSRYNAGLLYSSSGYNLTVSVFSDKLSLPNEFSASLVKKSKDIKKLKFGATLCKKPSDLSGALALSKGFSEKKSRVSVKLDSELNLNCAFSYKPMKSMLLAVGYSLDLGASTSRAAEPFLRLSFT